MKKFIYLFSASFLISGFISCANRDDEKTSDGSRLKENIWYLRKVTTQTEKTAFTEKSITHRIVEGAEKKSNVKINPDNTVRIEFYTDTNTLTFGTGEYFPEFNDIIIYGEKVNDTYEVSFNKDTLNLTLRDLYLTENKTIYKYVK